MQRHFSLSLDLSVALVSCSNRALFHSGVFMFKTFTLCPYSIETCIAVHINKLIVKPLYK